MGTDQSCEDDERSKCELASRGEAEKSKDERNDQNETSSEHGSEALDSFLTAILETTASKTPSAKEENWGRSEKTVLLPFCYGGTSLSKGIRTPARPRTVTP